MGQTRITIRPLRQSDTGDVYEIMHMPNVLWGTSLLPSTTIDTWRKTIESWVIDDHTHAFVADIDGKVVGTINLKVDPAPQSHIGKLTLAVHDMYQGQSIGKMLLITAIDLADNWLNLLRLELDVFVDNERAINLLQRFDFEVEGRKRCAAFHGGNYIDSYHMGRLHSQNSQGHAGTLTQTPIEVGQPQELSRQGTVPQLTDSPKPAQ
jgi:L-phenylalanine/L-methionine N-acetyltransferase